MINGHGDGIHNHGREIISNFSSNIYGRQDFSALHNHLCSCIRSIHSYPEPDIYSLIELLTDKNDIQSSNILVTNGAVDAIYLIAQTFSEYEDTCRINERQPEHLDSYFIIDLSYEAFIDKQDMFTVEESLKHKNVILLHSMAKSYAISGLRLGYITACNELMDKVCVFRMPWSINQLTIGAGKYLLKEGKRGLDEHYFRMTSQGKGIII